MAIKITRLKEIAKISLAEMWKDDLSKKIKVTLNFSSKRFNLEEKYEQGITFYSWDLFTGLTHITIEPGESILDSKDLEKSNYEYGRQPVCILFVKDVPPENKKGFHSVIVTVYFLSEKQREYISAEV